MLPSPFSVTVQVRVKQYQLLTDRVPLWLRNVTIQELTTTDRLPIAIELLTPVTKEEWSDFTKWVQWTTDNGFSYRVYPRTYLNGHVKAFSIYVKSS